MLHGLESFQQKLSFSLDDSVKFNLWRVPQMAACFYFVFHHVKFDSREPRDLSDFLDGESSIGDSSPGYCLDILDVGSLQLFNHS